MADKNAYLYHTFKAGDKGTIGGWKVDIVKKKERPFVVNLR